MPSGLGMLRDLPGGSAGCGKGQRWLYGYMLKIKPSPDPNIVTVIRVNVSVDHAPRSLLLYVFKYYWTTIVI